MEIQFLWQDRFKFIPRFSWSPWYTSKEWFDQLAGDIRWQGYLDGLAQDIVSDLKITWHKAPPWHIPAGCSGLLLPLPQSGQPWERFTILSQSLFQAFLLVFLVTWQRRNGGRPWREPPLSRALQISSQCKLEDLDQSPKRCTYINVVHSWILWNISKRLTDSCWLWLPCWSYRD